MGAVIGISDGNWFPLHLRGAALLALLGGKGMAVMLCCVLCCGSCAIGALAFSCLRLFSYEYMSSTFRFCPPQLCTPVELARPPPEQRHRPVYGVALLLALCPCL